MRHLWQQHLLKQSNLCCLTVHCICIRFRGIYMLRGWKSLLQNWEGVVLSYHVGWKSLIQVDSCGSALLCRLKILVQGLEAVVLRYYWLKISVTSMRGSGKTWPVWEENNFLSHKNFRNITENLYISMFRIFTCCPLIFLSFKLFYKHRFCSVSRGRPHKVDKRMVLEYTHGLFIT